MGVFKKDGMWWIDYYHKGKRYREKASPNKRQAENALGKRRAQIADDIFFESKIKTKRFSTFSKEVMEWYKTNRPRSVESISQKMGSFNEYFGDHLMDETTRADVEVFIEKRKAAIMEMRLAAGGSVDHIHFAVINRDIAYLRKIYNMAIERNHAKVNPCKGITKEKEIERLRYLRNEENEEARLLGACNPRIRNLALFSLHTGFRRGEIVSLEWSSVDLKRGLMRVEAVKSKNGTSRIVPINSVVREILEALKGDRTKPAGHVFLNGLGKPYDAHSVSQQFARATLKAGIEDFTFHDLRHTFASRLADRGVELLDLARLLGHKTIQMVMRYAHLTERRLQGHVDLLAEPDNMPSRSEMVTYWSPGPFSEQKTPSRSSRNSLN